MDQLPNVSSFITDPEIALLIIVLISIAIFTFVKPVAVPKFLYDKVEGALDKLTVSMDKIANSLDSLIAAIGTLTDENKRLTDELRRLTTESIRITEELKRK